MATNGIGTFRSFRVVVPNRVDIAGGTLDIYPLYLLIGDAMTVNAAVAVRSEVAVRPFRRGAARLSSGNFGIAVTAADTHGFSLGGKLGLLSRALRHFPAVSGVEIRVWNEAPVGSGIGASSALLVALMLPAGEAPQVGRLDLHRRPGGFIPTARGPGQPSGRQHQGDQQGGRRTDPGAYRGFVAHADLDAGNRGEMPQGAGEKTQLPSEGEAVGVGGGDRDPEISRRQPCRAAPERTHRDRAAHRDGGVHRHRVLDQEVQWVDVEGPPREVHAIGDHHPEGA